jgi:hypothetical protein
LLARSRRGGVLAPTPELVCLKISAFDAAEMETGGVQIRQVDSGK